MDAFKRRCFRKFIHNGLSTNIRLKGESKTGWKDSIDYPIQIDYPT